MITNTRALSLLQVLVVVSVATIALTNTELASASILDHDPASDVKAQISESNPEYKALAVDCSSWQQDGTCSITAIDGKGQKVEKTVTPE